MSVKIENLSINAGDFSLSSLNLEVASGEYFVLMGRTGSGKSLILKSICGLQPVASGTIRVNNRDITNIEPRARKIGYVPQNSDLFPHLSVERNIRFPLDVRGVPSKDSEEKIKELAGILQIDHLLLRTTQNLSGGERQKVALARALAATPDLLILDEPVSALDEPTRHDICSKLATVQSKLKITTIHVCHTLAEAESVADRIGHMHEVKGE